MQDIRKISLDALWSEGTPESIERPALTDLPEPAARYLSYALSAREQLQTRARLTMTGEILLKGTWRHFDATQVINWPRGFIWSARTSVGGLPIVGSDRFIDGQGALRWRLAGLIPVVNIPPNDDISRSSVARLHAETMWLPDALLLPESTTRFASADDDPNTLLVDLSEGQYSSSLRLHLGADGATRWMEMQRWGDPLDEGFGWYPFGAHINAHRTFDGRTIPSSLRVGWFVNEEGFDGDGEFWRATVTDATYQ